MRETIFQPGEGCGAFCILTFVGRGGTAEVYKAVHTGTQEVVALKCVRLSDILDSYIVDHMLAEADILSRGCNDNIVRVKDVGIDNGVLWQAMEFLSGLTLRRFLRRSGALPLTTALYYGREIAEGVASIHKMDVVHRDLKPENVIITEQNRVKVLDTGAAKFIGRAMRKTKPGLVFGTMLYISPEQLRGETIDARADIYSLGLTLYEMIAGRHPLKDRDEPLPTHEAIQRQLSYLPPPLVLAVPGVPGYLSDLVQRMIAKDSDLRPTTMDEVGRELQWMLTSIAADTRVIFAMPEGLLDPCPPSSAHGSDLSSSAPAIVDSSIVDETADTVDETVITVSIRPVPRGRRRRGAEAPTVGELVNVSDLSGKPVEDEADSMPTVPIQCACEPLPAAPRLPSSPPPDPPPSAQGDAPPTSRSPSGPAAIRDSLIQLQSGWIPASIRHPGAPSLRGRFRWPYLPVALGAAMMACALLLLLAPPAFMRPRAAMFAASSLDDAADLARVLAPRPPPPAAPRKAEEPAALPAVIAPTATTPDAIVPAATTKSVRARRPQLAGPRHYPEAAPPQQPKAGTYSPKEI